MSSERTISINCGDFLVSLSLNSSNVLQIEAKNCMEHYSYSIDKAYLQTQSQFFNLIYEPEQIIDYFKENPQKVIFEGGQLKFPYAGNKKLISILLIKRLGLKIVQQSLGLKQKEICELKENYKNQGNKIEQIFQIIRKMQTRLTNFQSQQKKRNQLSDKDYENLKNQSIRLSQSVVGLDDEGNKNREAAFQLNIKVQGIEERLGELQKIKGDRCLSQRVSQLEQNVKAKADITLFDYIHSQLQENIKQINSSIKQLQSNLSSKIELKTNNPHLVHQNEILQQQLKQIRNELNEQVNKLNKVQNGLCSAFHANSLQGLVTKLRQIEFRRKLGNHSNNFKSNNIKEQPNKDMTSLHVQKLQKNQQTNFINVYQILPHEQVVYQLKFDSTANIFIGCCSSDGLVTEAEIKGFFSTTVNKHHIGNHILVCQNDKLQVHVDLKKNLLIVIKNGAKIADINKPIPCDLQGKGLYFEIASEEAFEFDLSVKQ